MGFCRRQIMRSSWLRRQDIRVGDLRSLIGGANCPVFMRVIYTRDPSLRLKNGFAQDDAHQGEPCRFSSRQLEVGNRQIS